MIWQLSYLKDRLIKLERLHNQIQIQEWRARLMTGPGHQKSAQRHRDKRKELVTEYNELKYWFMRKMK